MFTLITEEILDQKYHLSTSSFFSLNKELEYSTLWFYYSNVFIIQITLGIHQRRFSEFAAYI